MYSEMPLLKLDSHGFLANSGVLCVKAMPFISFVIWLFLNVIEHCFGMHGLSLRRSATLPLESVWESILVYGSSTQESQWWGWWGSRMSAGSFCFEY